MIALREVPAERLARRTAEAVDRVSRRRAVGQGVGLEEARAEVETLAVETAATSALLDVVDDETVSGSVWLGRDGAELAVRDVVLAPTVPAASVLALLVERARAEGAAKIGIGVQPGDTAHADLAALPGFRLRATNMALALDGEISDPSPLVLRPMTAAEFDEFLGGEVEGFAAELVTSGMEAERALERSRDLFAELVPSGLESPGMEFHVAGVGDRVVGDLWLATGAGPAFVYNIVVRPEHRRRGYGSAIMNAAARHCRDLGHSSLGLNVFAHNPGARALYDGLGYQVTQDYSAFDLPDGD